MQFLYHKEAGLELLRLENEVFNHLKVRRLKVGEPLKLCNFKDDFLYEYETIEFAKKFCTLRLKNKTQTLSKKSGCSLALAVIDNKILEKTLPFLNELGLERLIMVYSEFSQKNFQIDNERLQKILIASSQQCGRTDLMELELFESVDAFLTAYPKTILVDFGAKEDEFKKDRLYFIGPEGGFSARERTKFKEKISFKSQNILRSQTASLALVSKILL